MQILLSILLAIAMSLFFAIVLYCCCGLLFEAISAVDIREEKLCRNWQYSQEQFENRFRYLQDEVREMEDEIPFLNSDLKTAYLSYQTFQTEIEKFQKRSEVLDAKWNGFKEMIEALDQHFVSSVKITDQALRLQSQETNQLFLEQLQSAQSLRHRNRKLYAFFEKRIEVLYSFIKTYWEVEG